MVAPGGRVDCRGPAVEGHGAPARQNVWKLFEKIAPAAPLVPAKVFAPSTATRVGVVGDHEVHPAAVTVEHESHPVAVVEQPLGPGAQAVLVEPLQRDVLVVVPEARPSR